LQKTRGKRVSLRGDELRDRLIPGEGDEARRALVLSVGEGAGAEVQIGGDVAEKVAGKAEQLRYDLDAKDPLHLVLVGIYE
jgi:hypothetical protein